MRHFKRSIQLPGSRGRRARGFTLVELLVVMAIIGILAAIAIPLFASVLAKSRIAKAQADARSLVTAVTMYTAHTGQTPATLDDLLVPTVNSLNQTAGPFMASLPCVPSDVWTGDGACPNALETYAYTVDTAGAFTVSATGDGVTVAAP